MLIFVIFVQPSVLSSTQSSCQNIFWLRAPKIRLGEASISPSSELKMSIVLVFRQVRAE